MILRFGKSKLVTGLVGLAGGILFSLISYGLFFASKNYPDAGLAAIAKNFFELNTIISLAFSIGGWAYTFSEKPANQEKYFTTQAIYNMVSIACSLTFAVILVIMVYG